MFDLQFGHREIGDIRRRETGANAQSRSCDEAISLMKGRAALAEVATPGSGADSFGYTQRSKPKASKEPLGDRCLIGPQSAPNFLHRDHAHPRFDASSAQSRNLFCGRATT